MRKIGDDETKVHKKIEYRIVTFSIVAICYLVMFVIVANAESIWFNFNEYGWSRTIENILTTSFWGLILYALPYEKVIAYLKYKLESFAEFWRIKNKDSLKFGMMFVGYALVCAAYLWYIETMWASYWRVRGYLILYVLASIIVVKIVEQFNNKCLVAIYSGLFIVINTYLQYYITNRFIYAMVAMAAMGVTWIIYSICTKKINILSAIISIVIYGLSFYKLIDITDHYNPWHLYLKGESIRTGASQLAYRREHGEALYNQGDYIFTEIYYAFGVVGLVVFAVLFAILIVATVYSIVKLYKVSKSRAAVVASILILFVGAISYCILQELGLLPVSTIISMSVYRNIIMIALAFRMFEIRKTRKYEVASYEELHGLDDDSLDEDYETINLRDVKLFKGMIEDLKMNRAIEKEIIKDMAGIFERLDTIENKIGIERESGDEADGKLKKRSKDNPA